MFPEHFRQFGFEPFGHDQNTAHFLIDFYARGANA
jgi:hypothetical protein